MTDSTVEDDTGYLLDPQIDEQIAQTLASLREKNISTVPDSRDYWSQCFGPEEELTEEAKFLRDYFVNEGWKGDAAPVVKEDEEDYGKMEEAEVSHNHRFEIAEKKKSARALRRKEKTLQKRQEKVESRSEELKHAPTIEEVAQAEEEDADIPSDHEWFLCDGCEQPILPKKTKYDCSECEDFCLCKACHKKISHEHKLVKSKVPEDRKVPKSWKGVVLEKKKSSDLSYDMASALTADILRRNTFKIDGDFKYAKRTPINIGLTDKELLELDDQTVQKLLPDEVLNSQNDQTVKKFAKQTRNRVNQLKRKKKDISKAYRKVIKPPMN